MSEKKLRRVLTSTTLAASLFLTAVDGHAGERTHRQPKPGTTFEAIESRHWGFQLWELLPRLWKAVSPRDAEDTSTEVAANAPAEKMRSHLDPNG